MRLFRKRRPPAPQLQPVAPVSPSAEAAAPRCSVCGQPLERRDPPPGSMLRPLYVGVVCRFCGWIECRACKGSPSDTPCPVCTSAVIPAYCDLVDEPTPPSDPHAASGRS